MPCVFVRVCGLKKKSEHNMNLKTSHNFTLKFVIEISFHWFIRYVYVFILYIHSQLLRIDNY